MFAGLKRLGMLDIIRNDLSRLDPSTFKGLDELQTIDASFNEFSSLEPNTFKGLRNLAQLDLSHNRILRLENGIFDELNNLKELDLRFNRITWIAKGVVRNLTRLTNLLLRGNRLQLLPGLNGLPPLIAQVQLSDNQIANLNGLESVSKIAQLDLSRNRIKSYSANVFRKMSVYYLLDLSHNGLQDLPDDGFANCTELLQLMLNHNNIRKISSRTFFGLNSLQQITLFHNKIVSISKLAFLGMPLQDLLLHNNNISTIEVDAFRGLNKTLQSLTLFSNPFRKLHEQFFDNMSPQANIAMTCSNLLRIPIIKESNITVRCAPLVSFYLIVDDFGTKSYLEQLLESGFTCRIFHGQYLHQHICTMCQPGYRGDKDGLSRDHGTCKSCPPGGFYQDEQGQVQCKVCQNGTYVSPKNHPGSSQTDCMACPQGTMSNESAGHRACRCLANFYRFDRFGGCSPCPSEGAICQSDKITLAPNYYWKWTNESQKRLFKAFVKNLDTVGSLYDKQFSTFDGNLPIVHDCPRKHSCLGGVDSSCSDGYQGPLCAICKQNYFLRMNTCAKCPSTVRVVLQIVGVIFAFVLVLLAVLWGDSKRAEHNRTWADLILSRFKIIVSFYQVMAAVFSALARVHWPAAVLKLASWFKYIEANILEWSQLSCIDNRLHFNASQQFLLVVCCNVIVIALIFLYMLIKMYLIKREDCSFERKLRGVSAVKRSCFRSIFVFLFATYPTTCVKIIQILPPSCLKLCYSKDEQFCQTFLRSDFSVQCFTPEHNRYWHAAAVMVLYPVGFPILVLILLWKYYYKLLKDEKELGMRDQPRTCMGDSRHVMQQSNVHTWKQPNVPDATFSLSLFYENYKPRFWFWEVTEMYRKLFLMCGLVFIGSHSRSQIGIGVLLSGFFSMLHAGYQPIADESENMLQSVALLVIFFDLSLGVMLKPSADSDPVGVNQQYDSAVVSVLFVTVNCLVIGIALVTAIKTIAKLCCKKSSSVVECDNVATIGQVD